MAAYHEIQALFVYSGVDAGHGINVLLREQEASMEGADKSEESYVEILDALEKLNGPPWRMFQEAFEEGATMENINFQNIQAMLNAVNLTTPAVEPDASKRHREPAEEAQSQETKPLSKKRKTAVRGEDIPAPPGENTPGANAAAEEPIEIEEDSKGSNAVLVGGVLAVTAGVAAIYLARRQA